MGFEYLNGRLVSDSCICRRNGNFGEGLQPPPRRLAGDERSTACDAPIWPREWRLSRRTAILTPRWVGARPTISKHAGYVRLSIVRHLHERLGGFVIGASPS